MKQAPNSSKNYVSRAALKLESVARSLKLSFTGKIVLDIGSSTGGFTDYALQNGARKVIAVDAGTNQLHPKLRGHPLIELHEKTDIRDYELNEHVDVALVDVSFISLREILPNLAEKVDEDTIVVAMVKPQFEVGDEYKHKGIIKNDNLRRAILKDFESWVRQSYFIKDKADSQVSGTKGNRERFYLLQKG